MTNDPTRGMKRGDILLLLVEARCSPDRYYVPLSQTEFLRIGKVDVEVFVYGGGDRSALNSQVRKGYITEVRDSNGILQGYRITDEGKKRTQELI